MPIYESLCPACNIIHHETADIPIGARPAITDFRSRTGAPAPSDGAAATCPTCNVNLIVRRRPALADARTNGATPGPSPVQILFEARPDEQVVRMDEQPDGRFLVVTTKRLLVVDLSAVLHHP